MIDHRRQAPLLPHDAPGPAWGRALIYALAVALTLATLATRMALGVTLDEPLLELFLVPIIISAYVGGLAPGLLATALAMVLTSYLVLPTLVSSQPTSLFDMLEWASLLVLGTLISALIEALHRARRQAEASQRLQAVTLASIGDGVIATDKYGRVTFLNAEAERLTGWPQSEAMGQPLPAIFRIVNAQTRAPVQDPVAKVLHSGSVVELANHTVLIGRDGRETPIDDSGAPIKQADALIGVVLVFRDIADRQRAEAALRESEAYLRTVTERAQVGLVIVNPQHRYLYANRAYADIFHLPMAVIIGQRVADVLSPVYETQIRPRLDRAFRGERVIYELAFPAVAPTLQERYYTVTYEPGVYNSETVVIVVVVEITEHKQAEQQLEYQATLLGQVSDAIISTDARSVIRSWNPAAEALYGWPAHDVIDRLMGEILPTTYLDSDAQRSRATLAEQGHWQGEVVQPHRDGTPRTILSSVSLLKDSAGNLAGAVGINRDITDRKRAERALERSAERLRVLADASRAFAAAGMDYRAVLEAVVQTITTVLGEGCNIRLISEDEQWLQLAALYDVNAEQLELTRRVLGETPLHVDEPSLATQIFHSRQPLLIPVVEPEQVRAATMPAYRPLVDRLGLRSLIFVPMRGQGRAIGVLTLYRCRPEQPPFDGDDLTLAQDLADRAALAISNARLLQQVQHELAARAGAEAEIRQLNIMLEQRVAERTAELAAANQELEAFSYSVSHDLRAPLRAIDGFARILLEDFATALPAEAQRYFQHVRDNAQQMGRLIDDLLAFSRLSRQPLSKRSVDVAALVRQCLDELQPEQAGRQIEIRIGALPACEADPALLKQVWLNLLSNALKYTRRRDPAVIAIAGQAEGETTIYSVEDNGVGFDMRYSDKLFGVFQRMHRAEEYEGTGVGLAIVQRIILRHGGRVWAEARIGQGATFYFSLAGG